MITQADWDATCDGLLGPREKCNECCPEPKVKRVKYKGVWYDKCAKHMEIMIKDAPLLGSKPQFERVLDFSHENQVIQQVIIDLEAL